MDRNPICWAAEKSFFELYDLRPAAWELEAIDQLEAAFMASLANETDGAVSNAKTLSAIVPKKRGKT